MNVNKEPSFIGSLFTGSKPTSVDGVLGAFRTAIADLNTVAEAESAKAEAKFAQAAVVTAEAKASQAEAKRATDIASKMAAVFN